MSFSTDLKDDLLNVDIKDDNANRLEIEAMIRLAGEISIIPLSLLVSFNSIGAVRRFIQLLKKYYKFEYELIERVIKRFDSKKVYTITIKDGVREIIDDLSLLNKESKYRADLTQEMKEAYLRGAFLVRGSVNDPNSKSSHLEISSTNDNEILFIQKLMNDFELDARISKRKLYYLAYIKKEQTIGDFLYHIGAQEKMTYYEDALITKEIKATAKRTINLDIANQNKTNNAAKEQIKYLNYLYMNYPLGELDNKLLMVMKVRLEHPEDSLQELLDIIHDEFEPNLSKSGLNHRLKRLKEIAIEFMGNNQD